ncbi:MAG: TMEM175 family protein [Candidatus Cybelea sp.]
MALSYNEIAGRSVERLGSLSDGVFAFAMTLLVLDLRVPVLEGLHSEGALRHALAGLGPNLLTYLLSFMTLGIFWVGQHTQLSKLKHSERSLTWIHLAFLLTVTMVPFSTKLLAAFITYRTAVLIYWLNIVALGATVYWSWSYALKANLVKEEAPAGLAEAVRRRIFVAQALYAVGASLCFISTYLSIGFMILVQLNYVIAPRFWVLRRL